MAGFSVLKDINDRPLKKVPVSSLTAAIGDLLELTAGSTTWAKVTSSSDHFTPKAILMETLTSASQALVFELDGTEEVRVEAANTANAAHNGDRMAATDENTVNNSGTDVTGQAVVFLQTGIGPGSTEIVGRVLVGNGVDPDAA